MTNSKRKGAKGELEVARLCRAEGYEPAVQRSSVETPLTARLTW